MIDKRIVLYVEHLHEVNGFAYLTYENGLYYAEFVKKGQIQYRYVIPQPTKVLVGMNTYIDLTKGVQESKKAK